VQQTLDNEFEIDNKIHIERKELLKHVATLVNKSGGDIKQSLTCATSTMKRDSRIQSRTILIDMEQKMKSCMDERCTQLFVNQEIIKHQQGLRTNVAEMNKHMKLSEEHKRALATLNECAHLNNVTTSAVTKILDTDKQLTVQTVTPTKLCFNDTVNTQQLPFSPVAIHGSLGADNNSTSSGPTSTPITINETLPAVNDTSLLAPTLATTNPTIVPTIVSNNLLSNKDCDKLNFSMMIKDYSEKGLDTHGKHKIGHLWCGTKTSRNLKRDRKFMYDACLKYSTIHNQSIYNVADILTGMCRKYTINMSTIYATSKEYVKDQTGNYDFMCLSTMRTQQQKIVFGLTDRFVISKAKKNETQLGEI